MTTDRSKTTPPTAGEDPVETEQVHLVEARSRAAERANYLSGLVWHFGTFVIINASFVVLDILGAGGINWSLWITAFWGIALAFHALAYFIDGRQLEERKTEQFLDEELRRRGHGRPRNA